jgi:hypothetical protein
MARTASYLWLAAVVACGGSSTSPEPERQLGMNDVTMLLPLPAASAPRYLSISGPREELIAHEVFDLLAASGQEVLGAYDDFQLASLRFDLCVRASVDPCPAGSDGSLRLVLQPFFERGGADSALHAFYPIPAAELGTVVGELNELARQRGLPPDAPLQVVAPPDGLRDLIRTYASAERLQRLTMFGQLATSVVFGWGFLGVEKRGATFEPMEISGLEVSRQTVAIATNAYDVQPLVDQPPGFALALDETSFVGSTGAARNGALAALAQIDNPTAHTAESLQCVSCHVSTVLTRQRAEAVGMNVAAIDGRYATSRDVSIVGGFSSTDPTSLHALGWLLDKPMISQRVANETAQVLDEIEERWPSVE